MKSKLLKISILSISMLTVMAGVAISPALGKIHQAFPAVGSTWIRMIVTIPSIMIMLFSLFSAKLVMVFRKRTIVIAGIILYILGGAGSAVTTSFTLLIISRMILGIGVGLIMPLANVLIADFYDGVERERMIGLGTIFINLGGVGGTLLAGLLATFNWRLAFLVYLLGVPVLILNIVGLSEPPHLQHARSEKAALPGQVIMIAIYTVLFMVAYTAVAANLSLFVAFEHLGSPGAVGGMLAIATFCGMVDGFFLTKTLRALKKAVIPLSLTLMSLGIGLLFLARSPWTVVVAMLVFGIGSGSVTPVIFLKTAQAVPPATRALAMSIVSSCIYFGQFLMPFVFSLIGAISGNASIRSAFLVFGCCTLLAAVIALFLSLAGKRKASAYSI